MVIGAHARVFIGSDVRGGEPVVPLRAGCDCGVIYGEITEDREYGSEHAAHVAEAVTAWASVAAELTGDEIDSLVYESGPDANHYALIPAVERILSDRLAAITEQATP